jgi:TRAP-type C4-dicarboxylate transport system permease small subunit
LTNLEIPTEVAAAERVTSASAKRSFVRNLLDGLYFLSAISGALSVLAVLVLMLVQVAYRQAGYIFRGADDLTAWCCAAAVFLPLAHTFKKGELVRMGLVMDHFQGAARRAFEIVSLASAALFAAYASYWAINLAYLAWEVDDRAQGLLPVPMWIPQSSMSVGLVVLFVALVDELFAVVRGREASFKKAARERREEADFSGEL